MGLLIKSTDTELAEKYRRMAIAAPVLTAIEEWAFCNHLLNDLQDPAQALKEFARVLRSRGRVVILMLHPCFYNKHAERSEPENNLPANTYFQARHISQNFEVDGLQSPVASTTWLHPLEFYTGALRGAGFVITGLTEPHPAQQMLEESAWWRTAFSRPLFMLITAELR